MKLQKFSLVSLAALLFVTGTAVADGNPVLAKLRAEKAAKAMSKPSTGGVKGKSGADFGFLRDNRCPTNREFYEWIDATDTAKYDLELQWRERATEVMDDVWQGAEQEAKARGKKLSNADQVGVEKQARAAAEKAIDDLRCKYVREATRQKLRPLE